MDRACLRGAAAAVLRGVADLIWPRACHLCDADLNGTPRPWLCASCDDGLPRFRATDVLCGRCSAPLGPAGGGGAVCPDCTRLRPRFDAAMAAGAYRGGLRRLVTGLKYARRERCAWPLGALLEEALARGAAAAADAVVVPVPSSSASRRARGYAPADLLADEVARRRRLDVVADALRRVGSPPPQASLPRTARLSAPRGTVAPGRRVAAVAGRAVLLVDDVLTTGATASECARSLRAAGAEEVVVLVAARTVTRGPLAGPDVEAAP